MIAFLLLVGRNVRERVRDLFNDELRGDQMRRLIEERKKELYAQWNAGLIHPLQSSAPANKVIRGV